MLREATLKDSQLFFDVRFGARSEGRERHEEWFAERIASPDHLLWVIEKGDLQMGYVRIGPTSTPQISIALKKRYQGKGYGPVAIRQATREAKKLWGSLIVALIDPENKASLGAFTKAGYQCVATNEQGMEVWVA